MCEDNDEKSNEKQNSASRSRNAVANVARRAEHSTLATLSNHAITTNTLEVTRPSGTNTPDGGHDIDVAGSTDEMKEFVSIATNTPIKELGYLDAAAKNGKLKARVDVKSGKTISGDIIDKHATDSNRSATYQINLLMLTNPDCKVTPEAKKRLKTQKELFKENKTLIDTVPADGLVRIKENIALKLSSDEEN